MPALAGREAEQTGRLPLRAVAGPASFWSVVSGRSVPPADSESVELDGCLCNDRTQSFSSPCAGFRRAVCRPEWPVILIQHNSSWTAFIGTARMRVPGGSAPGIGQSADPVFDYGLCGKEKTVATETWFYAD